MPFVTLCVTHLRCTSPSGPDAELPERHAHAEHGHDGGLPDGYRSSRSSVGMPFVTLCVTDQRRAICSREDAERPERYAHAEHGRDSDLPDDYRSSRSSVGMPFVTLCVTHLRCTSPSGSDAELPDRHTPRSTNRNRGVFHEDGVSLGKFSAIIQSLSRTSSLPRPAARIKRGLVYDDGHEGVLAGTCKADQSISLTTCSEGSRDLPAFSSSCT